MNHVPRHEHVRAAAILAVAAAAQAGWAGEAMAAGALGGAFGPVQTVLQAIVDFITGEFGKLVAIIAVMGLGFLAFAGRLSWFMAGGVIIGIGLVFGAPDIVDQLMRIARP